MKNKMMRIAYVLVVAVILSVCAVSGSFAKYVTASEGSDTARVAKWGVVIEAGANTIFASQYETDDETATFEGDYSVQVGGQSTDKLVAPGTANELAAISVSGAPEVAVKIAFEATVTLEGWMIPVATAVETTADSGEGDPVQPGGGAAASEEYYCPLKVTVGTEVLSGLDYDSAEDFAAAIKEAFEGFSAEYAPNTDLSTEIGDFTLAWEWAFEGDDVKDTALGNAAVESPSTISIVFAVTATQID